MKLDPILGKYFLEVPISNGETDIVLELNSCIPIG